MIRPDIREAKKMYRHYTFWQTFHYLKKYLKGSVPEAASGIRFRNGQPPASGAV